MGKKLFNEPMTLFQQNVNEIMKESASKELIEDLIRLNMFKNAEKDEKQLVLVELKTIKFPHKSDFKETIQIALCYYYRQFKDYSWEEIKELIKDDDLSSVKLGVRVQQLQRFINKFGELRYRRELNERHK